MRCESSTTVIRACPEDMPDVAVIAALPSPIACTRPVVSTVPTAVLLDDHANRASSIGDPFASSARAVSVTVSPGASAASAGVTITALTSCTTVTAALPDALPEVAVIAAVPALAAVATPEALTIATAASLVDQLTAAPVNALLYWSLTSAVNRMLSLKAVSLAVAGRTVTVVARGGPGGGGPGGGGPVPPSPSPHDRVTMKRDVPSATPRAPVVHRRGTRATRLGEAREFLIPCSVTP